MHYIFCLVLVKHVLVSTQRALYIIPKGSSLDHLNPADSVLGKDPLLSRITLHPIGAGLSSECKNCVLHGICAVEYIEIENINI